MRGIPGRIVYIDDGKAPMLRHNGLRLRGRPDAVTRASLWARYCPVEIKSTAPPTMPYAGDVAQLVMQGFLVEATWGRYPRVGYLVYDHPAHARRVFCIRLGRAAKRRGRRILRCMRSPRSHPAALPLGARCTTCPARAECRIPTTLS